MKTIKYDVIIVGAGMAGLGTAVALGKLNRKVLVISKKEKGESSPAAGGILDPFLEMHLKHPLFSLCQESFRRYRADVRELELGSGVSTGYRESGMIFVAINDEELKEIRKRYKWQRRSKIAVEWQTKKEMLAANPDLNPEVLRGLNYPTIARIHPPKLLRALKTYARSLGVSFIETKHTATLLKRGKSVAGVCLGSKTFEALSVVNALGCWASSGKGLGVKLPVAPARGLILIYKGKTEISTILHTLDGGYIVPWSDKPDKNGFFDYLVGSNVEMAGFKPVVTKEALEKIKRKNERLFPVLKKCRVVKSWAGLRPFSQKGRPFIGPSKIPGLWIAGGYYRSGILISLYAGELLAKSMVLGKIVPQLKPFDPRQFGL